MKNSTFLFQLKLATAMGWQCSMAVVAMAQPAITSLELSGLPQTANDTYHPYLTNSLNPNLTFSVSPGADVAFTVLATGTPPLRYQWQFNQTYLPGQTSRRLILTNVQTGNIGDYTVIVTNADGAGSQLATLAMDATFTKITTGPIVTNVANSVGGTWGDYNNDGYPDLFVFNGGTGVPYHPFLYLNNRDGTFTSITNGVPVTASFESFSATWGDFNNDGNLDLFVSTTTTNALFLNNGDRTFTQIFNSPVVQMSNIGTWVDYNNDGLLDLFLSGWDPVAGRAHNFIFQNEGEGIFRPVTNQATTELGSFWGGAWADYDNDGYPDLLVCSAQSLQPNRLYHNNGDDTFTRVPGGDLALDPAGGAQGCAWGDYDNDGLLDLFLANWQTGNFLYHNDGGGNFSRVLGAPPDSAVGNCTSCAWGDYDNDGFLDLFVTSGATPGDPTVFVNLLYHNNGDGTFTPVTTGSPVNEYSTSFGCSWVDYDNDGFLDLYASLQDGRGAYLYHNNGNSNAWLTVRLVGTASNRAAIGAKVRVNAFYAGASRWQLRQITGGSGYIAHNELQANFGLGDATNVDVLRIEWPSGIVQTLTNVAPKQILTVVEHQPTPSGAPNLTCDVGRGDASVTLSASGPTNLLYLFEASTNLLNWSWLGVCSNATGSVQFTDIHAANFPTRFYRASIP